MSSFMLFGPKKKKKKKKKSIYPFRPLHEIIHVVFCPLKFKVIALVFLFLTNKFMNK